VRSGFKGVLGRAYKLLAMQFKTLSRFMDPLIYPESQTVLGYCAHNRFKITIAVPPINDTDVYAHDVGLVAIENAHTGRLDGFNVLVGGGMGMTHGSKKTYARLGQPLGFSAPNDVSSVAEAIMLVQRDNGDRSHRKHARYICIPASC
jgi:Nitrite and sulphite reductase 4Fe-4S domain